MKEELKSLIDSYQDNSIEECSIITVNIDMCEIQQSQQTFNTFKLAENFIDTIKIDQPILRHFI